MKNSIEVFDFKEEDELAETTAGKLLEKFRNPSPTNSSVLQRQRIQSFCQDNYAQKELEGTSCAETATAGIGHYSEEAPISVAEAEESGMSLEFRLKTNDQLEDVNHHSPGLASDFNTEDHLKETDANHGLDIFSCQSGAKSIYGETSYSQCQLNPSLSDSSSSQEQNDMMSAINESMSDRSAFSQASDLAGDEDWMAEYCDSDVEKFDKNTAVIMTPEYVVLKDMPCAASVVIFSCNSIIIKGYPVNNEEGPFSCEWGIEDIVKIQYKWYQNVGLIILRIQVLLKDEKCNEDMQNTTDIEELKFTVMEHNWPEKQQRINSLHVKYTAVWNAELDDDVEVTRDNLHQQGRYFPSFDKPFVDVIYPEGDPDAVSICKRDVELLQPETFVNDTIIDFYINYLKNQIQAEEKHRFHFFNSFFFRKLADLDKDPSSISDGKAAFLRVRKWTRKVDMFGKDYIFVPVNFNLHWSLIVICHPGEVATFSDLDLDDYAKVPCILHMDSIKGSHAGLKNLVQSYLCEEWKERQKETSDDVSSRFMNLRFVSLELPQQENSFDCGLFLLHYLEQFLAEAPENFSPFRISKASNFLYLNWFPPAEASLKRTLIQKLIFELLHNRSRQISSDQNQYCESPMPANNNTGIEVLSERCNRLIDCNGNMTPTEDDQGIEMTLLERSSMSNMQAANDSGMVLRDLFDSGATAGSLLGQLQTFEEPSTFFHLSNASLAREQVDMETGEQFMCLNSGEGNFQRITGTASPRASISFSSWNLGMPVQTEHEGDSSPEASTSSSEDIGIIEANAIEKNGNSHEGETGASPPRDAVSLFPVQPDNFSAAAGSSVENEDPPSPHDEPVAASSSEYRGDEKPVEHDLEMEDNTSDAPGDDRDQDHEEPIEDVDGLGDDRDQDHEEPIVEVDENRAAKRPRLSSTGEAE